MKKNPSKVKFSPLFSIGLLVTTAPRMLELFAHYHMPADMKDFMIGLGVTLVAGGLITSRIKPAC
ncbi:MAG: hypothetical protein ACJ77K_18880 [Bacteroidia bacterium]